MKTALSNAITTTEQVTVVKGECNIETELVGVMFQRKSANYYANTATKCNRTKETIETAQLKNLLRPPIEVGGGQPTRSVYGTPACVRPGQR